MHRKHLGKIVSLLLILLFILSGCSLMRYELPSYQGILAEGEVKSAYNEELFMRNDKFTDGPDPFVFDNTSRDGYYYLFGTSGDLYCYRSSDLAQWEPVGNALDLMHYDENGEPIEERKIAWEEVWAPEMVYDEETKLYYLFFSASPMDDKNVTVGGEVLEGTAYCQLLVAVSEEPCRGFRLVNFGDPTSCGEKNLHTYNLEKYPHYYTKYFLLNPDEYDAFATANGGSDALDGNGGYTGCIDPHPYVDINGDKYLYWVDIDHDEPNRICVVKMDNWLKPDWNTATVLTYAKYYTVDDWKAAQNGQYVETVTYEEQFNIINEGPVMTFHNGKYYLTFSVNSYNNSTYQVGQAVGDSPMGPFRKLTEAEGGLLLSTISTGSQEISGTGHHSLVTAGEQTFIIYHRHNDIIVGGAARNPAIDEVKWLSITDKDGNPLDVMYTNGPTCTVQPKAELYSQYDNIAKDAIVSGSENVQYLTDGLLSVHKYGQPQLMEYVKETEITETTTFIFDFDEARTVRAVMVYNSKLEQNIFENISEIELVCQENGKEKVYYIRDVAFSSEYFRSNTYDNEVFYVTPGAAAYAEFDEQIVTSIRITVEVPEGQQCVGISEIRILGK